MTSHETPDVYYASIEEQYLAREGVDLRRSLTSPALAFRGGIFALLSNEGLVVRTGADAAAAAIEAGHGVAYRTGGSNVLDEWVLVPFDPADPHRWAGFVERAYEHARAAKIT